MAKHVMDTKNSIIANRMYFFPYMKKISVCCRNRLVKLSHQVGSELNRWQHQATLNLAYRDDLYHFHTIRKLLSREKQHSECEAEIFYLFPMESKTMDCPP